MKKSRQQTYRQQHYRIKNNLLTCYSTGRTLHRADDGHHHRSAVQMPVLVRSGGILPLRTDYVDNQAQRPLTQLTVNVAAGADGSFALYQDAGEGLGYQSGQSTTAPLSWSESARTLTIGAQTGSYPGGPTSRAYTLRLANSTPPRRSAWTACRYRRPPGRGVPTGAPSRLTTAALPLGSAHTVTLSGSATANPTSGEVLGVGGLCLDVRSGSSADGTALQLWGCNHTAAQTASYQADNSLRVIGKVRERRRVPATTPRSPSAPAPGRPGRPGRTSPVARCSTRRRAAALTYPTATPRRAPCSCSSTTATPVPHSCGSCPRVSSPARPGSAPTSSTRPVLR